MAHEIEIKQNGEACFFERTRDGMRSAWHKLGIAVKDAPTTAEAIRLMGADWTVSVRKVYTAKGAEIDGLRVIQRDTDDAVLGNCGDRFRPFQNVNALAWFDPFLQAGEASLETGGVLRNGETVWVLAKLNRDPIMVGGKDQIEKYLLLSNSHSGKRAIKVGFSPTRVVCANTLRMAHSVADRANELLSVRHTGRTEATLSMVRETVDTLDQAFKASAEVYDRLMHSSVKRADLVKYVCRVFDKPESDPPRCLAAIERNFAAGAGSDLAGDTAWGAYNAVTDYLTHEQGRDDATRLDVNAFGLGATVNAKALDLAYQYVTTGAF